MNPTTGESLGKKLSGASLELAALLLCVILALERDRRSFAATLEEATGNCEICGGSASGDELLDVCDRDSNVKLVFAAIHVYNCDENKTHTTVKLQLAHELDLI